MRTINDKHLRDIKSELARGQSALLKALLQNGVSETGFQSLREQKILLKLRDNNELREVGEQFKRAYNNTVADKGRQLEMSNYVDFVRLVNGVFGSGAELCESLRVALGKVSIADLLDIAEACLEESINEIHTKFSARFGQPSTADIPTRASLDEETLKRLAGRCNDIVFSMARAINEAAKSVRMDCARCKNKELLRSAKDSFTTLCWIANWWNSIEYAVDKISYGEWGVTSLEVASPAVVTFHELDPDLAKARHLGIRRNLVYTWLTKKTARRWLRDWLSTQVRAILVTAAGHYEREVAGISFDGDDLRSIESSLDAFLTAIDVDDDVIAATNPEIAAHYLAALLLRGFREVGVCAVEKLSPKRRRVIERRSIPIGVLIQSVSATGNLRQLVAESLKESVAILPSDNYLKLVANPFVKMPDNGVLSLRHFDATNWIYAIRKRAIKRGESIKEFGGAWEGIVAETLEGFGWAIVDRAFKLRSDGRTLTDIDVLAHRDGILLVVQVKAFTGYGVNVYEQWQSRNGILEGISQAAIAVAELSSNCLIVKKLLAAKKIGSPPRLIRPLVVTNLPFYSGWRSNGIPVFGLGELVSALRGGKVTYYQGDKELAEVSLCAGDVPTADEFVSFLQRPVAFQVAMEELRIEHIRAGAAPIDLRFPWLVTDADQITGPAK